MMSTVRHMTLVGMNCDRAGVIGGVFTVKAIPLCISIPPTSTQELYGPKAYQSSIVARIMIMYTYKTNLTNHYLTS